MKRYRYYSREEPIILSEIPKGNSVLEIQNYRRKRDIPNVRGTARGYVDFENPLTEDEEKKFDLCSSAKYEYFAVYVDINTNFLSRKGVLFDIGKKTKFANEKPKKLFQRSPYSLSTIEWFNSEEEQEKRYYEVIKFLYTLSEKIFESVKEFSKQTKGETNNEILCNRTSDNTGSNPQRQNRTNSKL